jgi:hypothetical protein
MLDFPQPICVHVENEPSSGYILGNPGMQPDFLDLRPVFSSEVYPTLLS